MKRTIATRTLIVDDSRSMRILVREVLSALGFRHCREATSVEEAITTLREFPAELIIVDYAFNGADGLSLVKHIRTNADERLARAPIIMVSGHGRLSLVQAAIDSGVNTFLVKPVSARAIADHVAFALSDRRPFVRSADYFGPERQSEQTDAAPRSAGYLPATAAAPVSASAARSG